MAGHYKTGPKKGQFKPGKRRKKKSATKKKRRSAKKKTSKKRRRPVAKKKRRRRRSAKLSNLMTRAKIAGSCAIYGWAKEHGAPEKMAQIPVIDTIGVDATNMLIAHFAAKYGPRVTRKWFDYLATGLAGKEGYMFGANNFTLPGSVKGLAAGAGAGAIGGAIDPDDFPEEDDDE